MARIILRKLSACCSSLERNCARLNFVTPSTMCAISLPKYFSISSIVVALSSTTSCSNPDRDGLGIELHIAKNRSDFQRMNQIRLARLPQMLFMDHRRKDVSLPDQIRVRIFLRALQLFDDVFNPNHAFVAARQVRRVESYSCSSSMRPRPGFYSEFQADGFEHVNLLVWLPDPCPWNSAAVPLASFSMPHCPIPWI